MLLLPALALGSLLPLQLLVAVAVCAVEQML